MFIRLLLLAVVLRIEAPLSNNKHSLGFSFHATVLVNSHLFMVVRVFCYIMCISFDFISKVVVYSIFDLE